MLVPLGLRRRQWRMAVQRLGTTDMHDRSHVRKCSRNGRRRLRERLLFAYWEHAGSLLPPRELSMNVAMHQIYTGGGNVHFSISGQNEDRVYWPAAAVLELELAEAPSATPESSRTANPTSLNIKRRYSYTSDDEPSRVSGDVTCCYFLIRPSPC
jgi:hypothetical protein